MKHVAVKSLLSVMLSLMMVVVFVPAVAFADEPDAADAGQATGLEVESNDTIQPLVEFSDQDLEQENEYGVESVEGGLNPVKATDYSKYGVLTVNAPTTPTKAGAGTTSQMTRTSAGTAYWPVTVTEPCVLAIYSYYTFSASQTTYLNIYRDSSCSNAIGGDTYIYRSTDGSYKNCQYFPLTSGGTYYIGVKLPSGAAVSSSNSMKVVLCVDKYAMATSETTIKPNKMYGVCTSAANSVVNLNLTAAKTGYLRVRTDASTSTVLKKAKDGTVLGSQQSTLYYPTFGVKKGRAYQLSTTLPSYNLSTKGFYVYAKNTAIKNKSGSSKKRAATLKKNKYKKGLVIAGTTKAQWFKFKKTNSKNFKFVFKGATNNTFKITIMKGSQKLTYTYDYSLASMSQGFYGPSGTYYIKVTPTSKSSGWYNIKWK